MIASATLDAIREAAHLPDVAGEYIHLKKAGRDWVGLCPFHAEKTPSFHVHEKFYKCFGCGTSGNVIGFVSAIEGVSFPEAAKSLADRYGVALDAPRVPMWKVKHERAEMQFAEWWKRGVVDRIGVKLTAYVTMIDRGTTEAECEAIGAMLIRVKACVGAELLALMRRCATSEERAEYEEWQEWESSIRALLAGDHASTAA